MIAPRDAPDRPAGPLVFFHIPKAAGTTLTFVLKHQYGAEAVVQLDSGVPPAAALAGLPEDPSAVRAICGHIGYRRVVAGQRAITLLRDPVARVVSQYRYLRALSAGGADFRGRPWLRDAVRMSLAEYAREGRPVDVRNGQARFLAGTVDGWWGSAEDLAPDPPDLLERAQANLRRFLFAGVLERFDEGLVVLRRSLGWRRPYYTRSNAYSKGRPRRELDRAEREALEEANRVDARLYAWVKRRFEDELDRLGDPLKREVAAFRRGNRRHQRMIALREGLMRRLRALRTRRG